jgi:hypothetical protein
VARLQPLATSKMPLDVPPPRDGRFGSPLVLSRVHWAQPELVAEVEYLTWTEDNLLRPVVYEGLREDKPAAEVRRAVPYPKPAGPARPAAPNKAAPAQLTGNACPGAPDFISRQAARPREPGAAGLRFNPDHRPARAASGAPRIPRRRRSSPLYS